MTGSLKGQATPIGVIAQLTDNVRNLLAAGNIADDSGKTGNGVDSANSWAKQAVKAIRLMIATVFDRQRGVEAAAELGGVGDQVHGVQFSVVRRPDGVAVLVIVEAEERMGVTSGQATELDEGLVDREGIAVEGIAAASGADRMGVGVDLEVGAQQTPIGLGAGIEPDAALSVEGRTVVIAVEVEGTGSAERRRAITTEHAVIGADFTADLEAGVGAGDVEEARAEGRADLHIFNGFTLGHGQIGSLGNADSSDTGSGAEEKRLHRHKDDLQDSYFLIADAAADRFARPRSHSLLAIRMPIP